MLRHLKRRSKKNKGKSSENFIRENRGHSGVAGFQMGDNLAQCLPTVADTVLLDQRQFRHGLLETIDQEERIVTEA